MGHGPVEGILDKGLYKKLELRCSIPRSKLKNLNLGPTKNREKTPNDQATRVTLASPQVTWSMNLSKPLNVAVVTLFKAEEGPPLQGDADVHRPSGKGTPPRGSSDDRRQGVLKKSTRRPNQSCDLAQRGRTAEGDLVETILRKWCGRLQCRRQDTQIVLVFSLGFFFFLYL